MKHEVISTPAEMREAFDDKVADLEDNIAELIDLIELLKTERQVNWGDVGTVQTIANEIDQTTLELRHYAIVAGLRS